MVLLAGCFGEGPSPESAAQATVLFALDLHPITQDDCRSGLYIGNVALGAEFGYAITHAFLPSCGGGTGNADEKLPSSVFQFHKQNGTGRTKIGDAGQTQEGGGPRPRVAARGNEVVWTYSDQGTNMIQVRSQSGAINGSVMSGPTSKTVVSGIVVDETRTFVTSWGGPMGPSNALSPRYPCCGSGTNNPGPHDFFSITNASPTAASGFGVMPQLVADQLREPLVANAGALYHWERSSTGGVRLVEVAKSGTPAPVEIATSQTGYPGGVAVDETHIAYSTTIDLRLFGMGGNAPHKCTIEATTVALPRTAKKLLETSRFTCLDLALDGNHVYFTIVELVDGSGGGVIRNRGVGRVNIDTLALETLALGIDMSETGPRQVIVDGDGLILVAPYVVARIPKIALDGKSDIDK